MDDPATRSPTQGDPLVPQLSSKETSTLTHIMTCMGVKPEEVPGNIITFLAMVGQGLFGGELAFKYIKLGAEYFTGSHPSAGAQIGVEAAAGLTAIIIAAAVIWGKYKLVRSFNRDTLTVEGIKKFFTITDGIEFAKAAGKLPVVLAVSGVFAGLNGISLDGFSKLLLEQSQAAPALAIASLATSIPSKVILGLCSLISNYFGFFWVVENGVNIALDIALRKNFLFRNMNYTRAEERIIASIRTIQNYSGILYDNNKPEPLRDLLKALDGIGLENTQIPPLDHDIVSIKQLEDLLFNLERDLNNGYIINNIIQKSFDISEENRVYPPSMLRQFAQYMLGLIGAGITVAGFSNFYELAGPSINQLAFGHFNLTEHEQQAIGVMDMAGMVTLALTVFPLIYSSLAPKGSSNAGNLSKAREAYIIVTCLLGGAPNILQALLVGQNPYFLICAELSSALVEYQGFKDIETKQYLESLKTTQPMLWFIISFQNIMEKAVQKIKAFSPKNLKEFHIRYNNTPKVEKITLPKSKYGCFWKCPPTEKPTERLIDILDSNSSEEKDLDINTTNNSRSSKRCGWTPCTIL